MEPLHLTPGAADHCTRRSGGNGGIRGMESVVATVSGYHGGERFKLIKLIAQTGANYVGAMSRSTTHLVCWRFEGKKHDLANSIGTHIVSHRWFEDCLKEGRRLPEGPYAMESGQEAGPIFSESSSLSHKHFKRRTIIDRDLTELPDHCNTLSASEVVRVDEMSSDFEYPEWSDSSLLKENFVARRNSKKIESTNVKKRRKSSEQGYKSEDKDVLDLQNDVSGVMMNKRTGESSYISSPSSSKQKGNLSAFLQNNAASRMGERSRLAKKASKSNDTHYPTESFENDCLPESFDQLGRLNTASVETRRRLRHTSASSSFQSTTSDSMANCDETSTYELEQAVVQEQDYFGLYESSRSLEFADLSAQEPALCNKENRNKSNSSTCNIVVDNENEDESKLILEESAGVQGQAELSCVICWTDFSSTRGILPCGHRFCYSCIQGWADCLNSRGKVSTCPLCKASFTKISKVEEAGSSDQKIYSQTIPCGASMDMFILGDKGNDYLGSWSVDGACYECHNREPEELLVSCHICQSQWVHSYCLDPPLTPWTCIHCRDLRMLYQRFR